MATIRVAVRDRRRLVREGLCLLLNDQPDIDAHEFVDDEAGSTDVILVANDRDSDIIFLSGARLVTFHDASTIDEIFTAVCAGARPSVEASPVDRPLSPAPAPSCTLTPREAEILRCIAAGFSAAEVSDQLGISHKTVEGHKRRIFTKLDVQNQAHAVAIATRAGLLEDHR